MHIRDNTEQRCKEEIVCWVTEKLNGLNATTHVHPLLYVMSLINLIQTDQTITLHEISGAGPSNFCFLS